MKRLMMRCAFLIIGLVLAVDEVKAFDGATFKFEKVLDRVYVGKQTMPLYPFMSEVEGPYITVNFYVIASEDKSELVLIDAPIVMPGADGSTLLVDLLSPFREAMETEFPGAKIKSVLLTHDHVDHISCSILYFLSSSIPVYVSSDEVAANINGGGPYDFPLALFSPIIINPGDSIRFEGGKFKAIELYGHTPGHQGYVYIDSEVGEINWLFTGDSLLAPPQDYDGSTDSLDITYCFRLMVFLTDTFDVQLWIENLNQVKELLTPQTKLFPGHGKVQSGVYWLTPVGYIDYTIEALQSPDFSPCLP